MGPHRRRRLRSFLSVNRETSEFVENVEKARMQPGKKPNSLNWASMAVNSTFAVLDKLAAVRRRVIDVTKLFVPVPRTASAALS